MWQQLSPSTPKPFSLEGFSAVGLGVSEPCVTKWIGAMGMCEQRMWKFQGKFHNYKQIQELFCLKCPSLIYIQFH